VHEDRIQAEFLALCSCIFRCYCLFVGTCTKHVKANGNDRHFLGISVASGPRLTINYTLLGYMKDPFDSSLARETPAFFFSHSCISLLLLRAWASVRMSLGCLGSCYRNLSCSHPRLCHWDVECVYDRVLLFANDLVNTVLIVLSTLFNTKRN
jgi:hypothetical protein